VRFVGGASKAPYFVQRFLKRDFKEAAQKVEHSPSRQKPPRGSSHSPAGDRDAIIKPLSLSVDRATLSCLMASGTILGGRDLDLFCND